MRFTLILFLLTSQIFAQNIADFEDFTLEPDSFLNGSDGSGGFTSGDLFIPNSYNSMFMSWTGWAISNRTDTTTPGFMNQYSAIAGQGVDSSSNFAVSFSSIGNVLHVGDSTGGKFVSGFYITNNTYAYLSIRDGDSFAKKFGGVSGDDPDFFLLTIKGYREDTLTVDSVDFYLADYRFEDNSEDYIIRDWTFVDLSSLGKVDSLVFSLSSTDVGQFGMNTPAYFCMDNFETSDFATSLFPEKEPQLSFTLYPNPSADFIVLEELPQGPVSYSLHALTGQLLKQGQIRTGESIDIRSLQAGMYSLQLSNDNRFGSTVFVKR